MLGVTNLLDVELSVEQASIAESESLVPSPDLEPTVWRNDRLGRFPCQLRRRVYDDAAVKMQPVVLCVRGKPACQLEGFVSAILNCASYRRTKAESHNMYVGPDHDWPYLDVRGVRVATLAVVSLRSPSPGTLHSRVLGQLWALVLPPCLWVVCSREVGALPIAIMGPISLEAAVKVSR